MDGWVSQEQTVLNDTLAFDNSVTGNSWPTWSISQLLLSQPSARNITFFVVGFPQSQFLAWRGPLSTDDRRVWPLLDLLSEGQLATGWTSVALVQLVGEHAMDIMGLIPGHLVSRHVLVKTEENCHCPWGLGTLGAHQGDPHLCLHDTMHVPGHDQPLACGGLCGGGEVPRDFQLDVAWRMCHWNMPPPHGFIPVKRHWCQLWTTTKNTLGDFGGAVSSVFMGFWVLGQPYRTWVTKLVGTFIPLVFFWQGCGNMFFPLRVKKMKKLYMQISHLYSVACF